MSEKTYAYSEVFFSHQGEGYYSGVPHTWLRLFSCSLQCNGFGQKFPTKPETYTLPYKDLDVDQKDERGNFIFNKMKDLPVFPYGCDSSYSWSAKFKRLIERDTARVIANKLRQTMVNEFNTFGSFRAGHMCFTGGEPLMKVNQEASIEVLRCFINDGDWPCSVTYETNGTQALTKSFTDFMIPWTRDQELFFSISPKLFNTSGEKQEKTLKPDVVRSYYDLSTRGQLKFVVNGTNESWEELEHFVKVYRDAGVFYPIWVMAIGATEEGQDGKIEGHRGAALIADQTLARGYNFAAREHVFTYGNVIGK